MTGEARHAHGVKGWAGISGALLAVAGLPACFEIPPRLPPDYRQAVQEPGWPPLAVYHRDPFHVANLLFHRIQVLGAAGDVSGDRPALRRSKLRAVDRVEIPVLARAICDALSSAGGDGGVEPIDAPLGARGLRMLLVDLGTWISDLERRGEAGSGEVVTALRALATHVSCRLEEIPAASALPAPPDGATTSPEVGGDHPLPPASALEAWELEASGLVRVFQLRRGLWLRGEAPWVELQRTDRLVVGGGRGCAAEERRAETTVGSLKKLCGECHSPEPGSAALPGWRMRAR